MMAPSVQQHPSGSPSLLPPSHARLSPEKPCPLCGGIAQASEGIVRAQVSLLACGHCRAFVMEKRLIDVVMNARAWNLRPVLRHVAFLSRAAQSAAAHGSVLVITSTNWIRVAMEQQRVDARLARSIDAADSLP
jgi:hypothetical protein